jgi:hypothetical protein
MSWWHTRRAIVAVAVVACAAAAAAVWRFAGGPVADGPGSVAGRSGSSGLGESPFRNTRAGVRYVGDAACAECHAAVAKGYHSHPMGRSAALANGAAPIERYDAAAGNPFTAFGLEFAVERAGGRLKHRVTAHQLGAPPDYVTRADVVIGSGTRGRAYLSVEGSAVWQSPVSWFTAEGRWDVSPRPELEEGGRRPVTAACLYCHTDRVTPVPGAVNRFVEPVFPPQVSVGCERCHGPGELHVAERRAGGSTGSPDDAIVNPKHLPAHLQTDICRQCHLQGVERVPRRGKNPFDYRPGLPWDQFMTTLVVRPDLADYRKSVGQFEQMEASRCFAGSNGGLTCVSCHDPHEKPAGAAARFYRSRCLNCHEQKPCTAPPPSRAAAADNCAACHMPKAGSSSVPHTAVTDHRMLRRPDAANHPGRPDRPLPPILPYPGGPHAPSPAERDRDWAVGVARLAVAVPAGRPLALLAEQKLIHAVDRRPDDADAWEALARLRGARGDIAGALKAARASVEADAASESAAAFYCQAAAAAGDTTSALAKANTLVAADPSSLAYRLLRADVHLRLRDWKRAEADAAAALAIQPLYGKARVYLAVCHHNLGDPAGASRELQSALNTMPTEQLRESLRAWFKVQTRP